MKRSESARLRTAVRTPIFFLNKVLKAVYAISYEPEACVWHKHRREIAALRRQLYGYSKGHVAYHLTTLIRDRDLRAVFLLAFGLPRAHFWRIKQRLRRRSIYPLSLIIIEILGNLASSLALWRSRLRVKREGKSEPYIPASQRSILIEDPLSCERGFTVVGIDNNMPSVFFGEGASTEWNQAHLLQDYGDQYIYHKIY